QGGAARAAPRRFRARFQRAVAARPRHARRRHAHGHPRSRTLQRCRTVPAALVARNRRHRPSHGQVPRARRQLAPRSNRRGDPFHPAGVPDRPGQPDRRSPHPRASRGAREGRGEGCGPRRGSKVMNEKNDVARVKTGVRNLDALLLGGLPKGTVAVLGGPPGAGKTILAQQICFHNASPETRVLYFNTLSEPTAKTLRYLTQFQFFDAGKIEASIQFVDLGVILRVEGLAHASSLIMEHVKKVKPGIVVVDSFKAFDDLAESHEELRKFGYELAVNLMAWETTALLLGEYGSRDLETNPLFSVVDGLLT